MKFPAIVTLLCAAAVPASALAQATGAPAGGTQAVDAPLTDAPVLKTKWSLKQPRRKAAAVAPQKEGPPVPKPVQLRVPKPAAKRGTQTASTSNRVNATPVISQIARGLKKKD